MLSEWYVLISDEGSDHCVPKRENYNLVIESGNPTSAMLVHRTVAPLLGIAFNHVILLSLD